MDLRAIVQSASESDRYFSKRINDAVASSGIVHSTEDTATLVIYVLDATIGTLVARHRESHIRTKYLELVQLYQDEVYASRAKIPHSEIFPNQLPSRVVPVHLIKSFS